MTIYVLMDCKDYYGPNYVCACATLDGAQARAQAEHGTRSLRWSARSETEWETKFGEYVIERQEVLP